MIFFRSCITLGLFCSLFGVACSDDAAAGSGIDAGADAAADAGAIPADATSRDAAEAAAPDTGVDACGVASAALSSVADTDAPSLDAAQSNLQRVTANDAFCTSQRAGAHPSFGGFGYLLNVFLHDEQADAPALADLASTPGLVRFGSSPAFDVSGKLDPEHGWTTQGEGFILQLCLDESYAPGAVTIAVDVADMAGHRSRAICVDEAGGF